MTPAQKLKMGKAIADDIRKRYEFTRSGKPEVTLYEAVTQNKPVHGQGMGSFLMFSNPLFKKYSKGDVLSLLVEKKCIKKESVAAYNERLWERNIHSSALKARQANQERNKKLEEDINGLGNILHQIEGQIHALEEEFLGEIQAMWKSGELKHTLLTHTTEKKRKTTLARAVPINQLYPEKTKKQVHERVPYDATDIVGLDRVTTKQFQALQFLAHKAQNQTDEEKKALKLWEEIAGETHRGFRIVAFKESEYITQSQGKDSAIVSSKEKASCMKAIDAIKDITFTIRWEKKGEHKGQREYVINQHPLIKTLNPKQPWLLVKEEKNRKEVKKFQFIAIPERLFEYKETGNNKRTDKCARVLFDVINIDPDFFSKLKYADPEMKHVSESLMKLALIFLVEGSFNKRTEFVIEEEKLLNRIGLLGAERRHKTKAKNTLDTYIRKLINQGALDAGDKKEKQRVFKWSKKKENNKNQPIREE